MWARGGWRVERSETRRGSQPHSLFPIKTKSNFEKRVEGAYFQRNFLTYKAIKFSIFSSFLPLNDLLHRTSTPDGPKARTFALEAPKDGNLHGHREG